MPVNSLLGGNQVPISLTQFYMREASVAAFLKIFFYFNSFYSTALIPD